MQRTNALYGNEVDWIGLLSFGIFLLILGVIWFKTPELIDKVRTFILDFRLHKVQFLTFDIFFPSPEHTHPVVYKAIMNLSFAYAASYIVILTLRFIFQEPIYRKADSLSGMIFWIGIGYFSNMLLKESISWFGFMGGVMFCAGISITVSGLIKLIK